MFVEISQNVECGEFPAASMAGCRALDAWRQHLLRADQIKMMIWYKNAHHISIQNKRGLDFSQRAIDNNGCCL